MDCEFEVNEELLDFIGSSHMLVQLYISCLEKKVSEQHKRISYLIEDRNKTLKDASVQTGEEEVLANTPVFESTDESPASLIEELKEQSNSTTKIGERFVFEQTTGLYYDTLSGYYYDASRELYYDGTTGTYLSYNYDTQNYEVVNQVYVQAENERPKIKARKRKKNVSHVGSEFPGSSDIKNEIEEVEEQKEEGEITDDESGEETRNLTPVALPYDDQNGDEIPSDIQTVDFYKLSIDQPPCMRLILQSCQSNQDICGMFFIIPYTGGSIGKSDANLVSLQDDELDEVCVEIKFDESEKVFKAVIVGSTSVTVNTKELTSPGSESEVVHGSIIKLGTCKLLAHIHKGAESCGHCEPGLLHIERKEEKHEFKDGKKSSEKQRRKEMKRLKEKYGIQKPIENVQIKEGYEDRAEARRKEKGVDYVNAKVETASIDASIKESNKGFKMLSQMGWSKGEGIGKTKGIAEPIRLEARSGTAGLGAEEINMPPLTLKQKHKRAALLKTKQRFEKLPEKIKDTKTEELF
ncbi:angiogenic factor with G patch and FHA domains 1-like isoform X2 [Artemia franciscana]|nr:hypothetical protein QYM36_013527 [Artemia franciscana]KAK2709874.1 hypothetical protein QYM36_013527 [Artemia franciscana]KAK2709876.1 hypothetical protein QYM36_013527 [Artemia franciscana]